MRRDKCHGCERYHWDYRWRANGCSSNLCAALGLTHSLPLEASLTSLRDGGLFTDHWLKASFGFLPASLWSYERGLRSPTRSLWAVYQSRQWRKGKQTRNWTVIFPSPSCVLGSVLPSYFYKLGPVLLRQLSESSPLRCYSVLTMVNIFQGALVIIYKWKIPY